MPVDPPRRGPSMGMGMMPPHSPRLEMQQKLRMTPHVGKPHIEDEILLPPDPADSLESKNIPT